MEEGSTDSVSSPPCSTRHRVPADIDRHIGVIAQERYLADARRSRRPQEASFELSVPDEMFQAARKCPLDDALPDIRIPSEVVMFRPFRYITHPY